MQKINFQNLPSTTTPINATNLNALQTNVETEFLDYLKNFKYLNNVDLNDLETSGIYYCGTGLTNAPISSYVYLFVMSAGSYDITQIAMKLDTIPVLYIRARVSIQGVTQWGDWKKIISDEYLGSNPDINSLKNSSGIYGLYNCSQAPTLDIGVLEVLIYTNDWVIQRFTTVDSSPHMWERCFTNGTTWNNWIQRW